MDLNALMSTMLSEESIANIGQKTGAKPEEVRGVLGSALPLLLNGASAQANNPETASGFVGALQQHAQDDASNVSGFLGNVDMGDGAKIIAHLLGANMVGAQTQAVAQQVGVSQQQTGNILAAVAPLLLTLLGQQAASGSNSSSNNALGIGGLMGSLMGSGNMTSLLGAMLGGGAAPAAAAQQPLQQIVTPAQQAAPVQQQAQAAKPQGLLGKLFSLLK